MSELVSDKVDFAYKEPKEAKAFRQSGYQTGFSCSFRASTKILAYYPSSKPLFIFNDGFRPPQMDVQKFYTTVEQGY